VRPEYGYDVTMTTPSPQRTPPDDNEAEELVELLSGEGPIEHPGAVEEEEDSATASPASDADAPPPL
jgi:hypothetical protein